MRHALAFLLVASLAFAGDTHVDRLGFSASAGGGGLGVMGEQPAGGIRVTSVDPGGFAEKGGLQKGDLIAQVEDQPVGDVDQLLRALPKFATEVRLQIVRGGAPHELIVPLAPPPKVPPHLPPPQDNPPHLPNPPPEGQPIPPVSPPAHPPAGQKPPAPSNVLPYLITDRGLVPGKTTWRVERLCKGPFAQPIVSADGRSVAWLSPQGALSVWQEGNTSELKVPVSVLLLGWLSPTELAYSMSAQQAEVDAIDVKTSQVRTLFAGDHAAELLPNAACIVGYVPASQVFARVIVAKPTCTVSFTKLDGGRFGTIQPFDGPIVAASFAAGAVLVVKGTPPSTAGDVYPVIPGMMKQGPTGVKVPDLVGQRFAPSPNGRYTLVTAQGQQGGTMLLLDGGSGDTKTLFQDTPLVPIAWPTLDVAICGSDQGLVRLWLVPRNAQNLEIEARQREGEKKLDEAEALWRELVGSFPQTEEAGRGRAWIDAREKAKIQEAILATEAEADRLAQVERYEEAIARLEAIRAQYPTHPAVADILQRVATLRKQIQVREERKRDERIARLLAQAQQTAGMGHLDEAIRQYQAVRAEFPGQPCDGLAAGKIAELEQQIEEQKRAELARMQQGLAKEAEEFAKTGDLERAIAQFEEIRKRWPGSVPSQEAARRIAALEAQLKETKAAEFAARMRKRIDLAAQLSAQGSLTRAMEELKAVVAADPENSEAKLAMSDIDKRMAEMAEKERAARVEEKLAAAKVLLDAGSLDEADAGYKAVIQINPENAEARAGIERVAAERKKKEVAQTLALAHKALDAGQLDAAREAFRKVLAIDENNQDAAVGMLAVDKAAERAKTPPPSKTDLPPLPPDNSPPNPKDNPPPKDTLPPLPPDNPPPPKDNPPPKPPTDALPPPPPDNPPPKPKDEQPPKPPDTVDAAVEVLDFTGLKEARLQDDGAAVEKTLGKPDQREKANAEGCTQWTYAAKGVAVILNDESGKVVAIQAMGSPQLVTDDLRGNFHAFAGKTDKGVAIGMPETAILDAYGAATRGEAAEGGMRLVYKKDKVELSFSIQDSKVVLIMLQQLK